MKRLLPFAVLVFLAEAVFAQHNEISSPDGRVKVSLAGSSYSVEVDGKTALLPSPLGFVANTGDYSDLSLKGIDSDVIRESYTCDRIKKSSIDYEATRALVTFTNPLGREVTVEFRVSTRDVAFRYLIPKDSETASIRILEEKTGFVFPDGTTTFLTPQSDAMTGWKRTKPSYEEYYTYDRPMDERSQFGHGYTFPCLFRSGDVWTLVSETGVDSRYCASRLSDFNPETGGYSIAFPMAEENNGNGTSEPAFALPGATPWRTVTVGGLADIVQTTVTWDVVEPRYVSEHDYSYGKGTWSWILWQDQSINYDDQVKFIELSAALGFDFVLVDNLWDQTIGRERMAEMVKYAASLGVEVILWYSSSGWWNDITQSPVDVMSDHIARKAEMKWLESIGVKGIKVDFFGGDKQETMRHYESILSDADDHGLMVIFHGCTIPRGWERMYPNYVGSEAVRASENLVFGQYECDIESRAATTHPFIRNTLGCMEFGGCFLNRYLNRNNRPHPGPFPGSIRRTSDAFELATAVLFQNPVQNFALAPNNLTDAPTVCLDFLREVPTTWDDTKLLCGYPGRYAVLARRHGNVTYVAVANSEGSLYDRKKVSEILSEGGITVPEGASVSVISSDREGLPVLSEGLRTRISVGPDDGAVIIIKE